MGNPQVGECLLVDKELVQPLEITSRYESLLLSQQRKNRAIRNIGGIANFSILPKGNAEGCYDFDTGPGNVYIDAAVLYSTNGDKDYDKDGAMGANGKVHQSIVDEVLAGQYFRRDIPKTTAREMFGERMAEAHLQPNQST